MEEWYYTNCIPSGPYDEVYGDCDGFLGLACHISRYHGQSQSLGTPKGECNVVAYQQADVLGKGFKGNGHEAGGSGKTSTKELEFNFPFIHERQLLSGTLTE